MIKDKPREGILPNLHYQPFDQIKTSSIVVTLGHVDI